MKLTIDSSERLENVLRAVGGLYGVDLAVGSQNPSPVTDSRRRAAGASNRSRGTETSGGPRASRSARRSRRPSSDVKASGASQVRAWAAANGYEVSSRGTLPAAVRDAYDAAHTT